MKNVYIVYEHVCNYVEEWKTLHSVFENKYDADFSCLILNDDIDSENIDRNWFTVDMEEVK